MLGMKHVSISSTNPPKHVLNDVSGFVVKGGITAILGGSSSGKSLLMKYLTGRVSHLEGTGEVTLNGKPFFPNRQKNGFGFVPQEDFLIGDITVRETFEIALSLRKNLPEQDRKEEADRVIKALGLGRVGDNVVGTILKRGLSGGEKRRCSVGNELVVRPQVLFL
jgi:ABC-type multidrug transport system ATPase subunit